MSITFYSPSGFNWALLINAFIALIAVGSLSLSFWFNRKTLRQTKALSEKALTETTELFKRQIDFQFLEKKHHLIRYFVNFFNKKKLKLEAPTKEEFNTFIENVSLIVTLYKNDEDAELIDNVIIYTDYIMNKVHLPDYTDKYTSKIEKEKGRVPVEKRILFAFCHHIGNLCVGALTKNSFENLYINKG